MDLQTRKTGKLPEIEIAGTMFFVDIRLRELRADYTLMSRINLDQLKTGPDGDTYLFVYNPETREVVNIDPEIIEWPKDLVIVEVPGDLKLDPYAIARDNNLNIEDFVKRHPIEKELQSKIIPLEETGFAAMIEKNKQKKQQQPLMKKRVRQGNKGNRIK